MNEDQYIQCAIAAMQGIQESGNHLGEVLELVPEFLAKKAFDIADAMKEEYNKRTHKC